MLAFAISATSNAFNLSFRHRHLPVSLEFLYLCTSRHPSFTRSGGILIFHLAMDAKMPTVADTQTAVAASTGAEDANLADADDMELLGE